MQILALAAELSDVVEELQLAAVDEFLAAFLSTEANATISREQKDAFSRIAFLVGQGAGRIQQNAELEDLALRFGLAPLLDHTFLARAVTAFRSASQTQEIRNGPEKHVFWTMYYLSRTIGRLVATVHETVVAPRLVVRDESEAILDLQVHDFDGDGVTLFRLAAVLRSLERIHAALAQYLDPASALRIAYADSGSDIALGVIAKKVGIAALQSLFRDGLKHLRFWKENGFDRRLESLGRGLTFVAEIRAKGERGEVDPELVKRLESAVLVEMEALLSAGVSLREPIAVEPVAPHQILRSVRDQRLLSGGSESSSDDAQ
jgi:hypothetical protein